MIRTLYLLGAICAGFLITDALFGYQRAYAIGYGAFTAMALMVSGTFFWLWHQRATPLAMGMFFGWAGAAGVMGWWWVFNLFQEPDWMGKNPFLFLLLSCYFVGALLHFQVIWRSFGWRGQGYLWPVAASLGISILAQSLF